MSKRCELQKEYYKAKGNYKGSGKYSDDYVMWLEDEVLALRQPPVSNSVCCGTCYWNNDGICDNDIVCKVDYENWKHLGCDASTC